NVVAAFTADAGDYPWRRAFLGAQQLVARGLCEHVILDVAMVNVRSQPDGSPRFLSPLFLDKRRYPAPADPPGILLTKSARETLGGVAFEEIEDRPELALAVPEAQPTILQQPRTPLVGRQQELQALFEHARESIERRRPGIATVLADPGLGKSRLGAA